MKTITTKIPNKENKGNYALMHRETFDSIDEYLKELPKWIEEDSIEDWIEEIRNELGTLRKL